MAFCTFSAFFKAYTPRLLFSVFCCSATLVFALACYMLLLSSASMASLAAFLPQIPTASIIYSNCRSSRVGDDRGSQLFHSWSDAELFERALSAESKLAGRGDITGFQSIATSGTLRNSLFPIAGQANHGGSGDHYVHQSFFFSSNSIINHDSFPASSPSSQRQPSCRQRLPRGNPKIAFLFLTTGPLHFAPLWNQFFHGHEHLYNIYIHLDPFRVGVFDRKTAGVFWGRLIPPDRTERGAPSLVAAERRLLANALLDDPLNHYFALISERCIPLASFHTVYNHVMGSDKSFLEILTDAPTLYGRYEARGSAAAMLPEVPFESFRVGSQFFVLTREHAVVVISDERIWRKFKTPCVVESNCYAEEHYFPTLIDMEDAMCATRYTLTNVDWSQSSGDGHPRTYGKEEVGQELIMSLRRNNTFLFARKFADDCIEPLMQISTFIVGEEGKPNAD